MLKISDFKSIFLVQKRVADKINFMKDVQRMREEDREHLEVVADHGEEFLVFGPVQG